MLAPCRGVGDWFHPVWMNYSITNCYAETAHQCGSETHETHETQTAMGLLQRWYIVEKPQRHLFQPLWKMSAVSTYDPTAQPPKHGQHRGVTSCSRVSFSLSVLPPGKGSLALSPCTLSSKEAQCILVPSPPSENKGTNQRCWDHPK